MLESVIKLMFRHKSVEARRYEAHLAEIKNLIVKGGEDPESVNPPPLRTHGYRLRRPRQ